MNYFFRHVPMLPALISLLVLGCFVKQADAAFKPRWQFHAPVRITAMTFSPKGNWVAVGTAENEATVNGSRSDIYLLSPKTGKSYQRVPLIGNVVALRFTPDGKHLLSTTGGNDITGSACLWSVPALKPIKTFSHPLFDEFTSMALSPDGKVLACGGYARIFMLRVPDFKVLHVLMGRLGDFFGSMDFSSDGRIILGLSDKASIRTWRVATGEMTMPELGDGASFRGVAGAFLKDENVFLLNWDWLGIASKGFNDNVKSIPSPMIPVSVFALNKSQTVVATGSGHFLYRRKNGAQTGPEPVQIWDLKTGKLIGQISGHKQSVTAVAYAPNGDLVSGDDGATVIYWEQK